MEKLNLEKGGKGKEPESSETMRDFLLRFLRDMMNHQHASVRETALQVFVQVGEVLFSSLHGEEGDAAGAEPEEEDDAMEEGDGEEDEVPIMRSRVSRIESARLLRLI